jgi:uncharacterized NAD-dependent epimerase/dehydratase family protein
VNDEIDGNAIVFCQGAFGTTNGKTAHGLVRRTTRYHVVSVIDSHFEGEDAGMVLDGRPSRIPIYRSVVAAIERSRAAKCPATHFVVGLAPDGGRLPGKFRPDVIQAISAGLNVDSGLHDFFSEDRDLARLAEKHGVRLRDVRKPPPRDKLHSFTGRIEQVECLKVAVLGTDSAVGKRTTAWLLVDALRAAGHRTELIGTGQTAWMQGARYGIILDSLVNDFVAGELEHAVLKAWETEAPHALVIEGQGSLMNPAYPGGLEILAATRPDVIVLQHAPARKEYDGFPGYPIHPLERQIQAIELLSDRPVVAITVNHESIPNEEIPQVCEQISRSVGLPVFDVLLDGADELAATVMAPKSLNTAKTATKFEIRNPKSQTNSKSEIQMMKTATVERPSLFRAFPF